MRYWCCPYWKYERKLKFICEAGTIHFFDRKAWSDYVERYCCDRNNWEKCTLAQSLNREYERRKSK